MYCNCFKPFKVTSGANGEVFEVCSSGLGGCGLEIKDSTEEAATEADSEDSYYSYLRRLEEAFEEEE